MLEWLLFVTRHSRIVQRDVNFVNGAVKTKSVD